LRAYCPFFHLMRDPRHFLVRHGSRLSGAANESRDLRRRPHQVPGVVIQLHVNEDVAGEELPRRDLRLTLHELLHLLGRNQDLAEELLLAERLDALFEGRLRLLLRARVGMNDVPLLSHRGHGHSVGYESRGASSLWMTCDRLKSTS